MNVKGISVIIPNYNGRLLLEQIIPPLIQALAFSKIEYEIIVVDDCSVDDSILYLQEYFKEIIVLRNDENTGFSKTINKGIFSARLSHLMLLNSDVKLSEDYFIPLLRYFDKPDTFGVMGRITGWDNDIIQDGGKYPFFHGAKIKTSGNYVPLSPSSGQWLYSIYLSGANAFVDKEKVLLLKGFDEIFSPFYIEDYELCLRAWRVGWKCYYEHLAVCRHKTSATIKSNKKNNEVAIIYNRNKMYLHAIHLNGFEKFLWYLQLAGELIIKTVTFKFYYLQSLYLFLGSYKKIDLSRKTFSVLTNAMQENLSVKSVVKKIKSSLDGQPIKRF